MYLFNAHFLLFFFLLVTLLAVEMMSKMSCLPYSLDLSPTNYHFFKHLNNFLQGKHFHNQREAENTS